MSTAQIDAEDRLFLVDASKSMNEKVGKDNSRKLEIIKEGLRRFCGRKWPDSYYPMPLRIGIVAFRRAGLRGRTELEEIVPLYPEPTSLDLWRLGELSARGETVLVDALEYGLKVLGESLRGRRGLVLVSGGENSGENPLEQSDMPRSDGITVTCVEISSQSSAILKEIAARGKGGNYLVDGLEQLESLPSFK